MRPYVSLHNHTIGSIGDSLITPKDLIEKTKQNKQQAIAITDHGSLSAVWDTYKISRKTDIKLIVGCECYFVDNADDNDNTILNHLVLLAKNAEGYKNLLTLNKLGFDKYTIAFKKAIPRVDWDMLKSHSQGLICTSACGNGMIGQHIMHNQFAMARNVANKFRDIFGDDFVLELQPHNLQRRASAYSGPVNQQKINKALKELSSQLDIKCIIATDAHYVQKEHFTTHDSYICISSGQPISSGARLRYDKNEFYMKTSDEVYEYFVRHMKVWGEDFVESLFANTVLLADKCENPDWVDPAVATGEKCQLPEFDVKSEPDYSKFLEWKNNKNNPLYIDAAEDAQFYRYRSEIGLEEHISSGKIPKEDHQEAVEQMLEEFDVFECRGFSSYMLITADFLNWCRENDISVGPGRGCTTKDTLVLTPEGYREINEIKGGDYIFSGAGKLQKVICRFNNQYADDLVNIKTIWSFGDQKFTKDHLLVGITRDDLKEGKQPQWIPAGDLSKGDLLFHPWPKRKSTSLPKPIDLSRFVDDLTYICNYHITDNFIEIHDTSKIHPLSIRQISRDCGVSFSRVLSYKNGSSTKYKEQIDAAIQAAGSSPEEWKQLKNTKVIPRFIDWDEDFCYLLGRWIGDGSFHGSNSKIRGITITFCSDDSAGIEKTKDILNKYFGDVYVNDSHGSSDNCVCLTVCSEVVGRLFSHLFPSYRKTSCTKHFPLCFRVLPDHLLKSLLLGYFDADGCKKKHSSSFKTTSKRLAMETREILLYLKIPSGCSVELQPMRYDRPTKTSYTINCSGFLEPRKSSRIEITSSGFYSRITELKDCPVREEVYDLKVKNDFSYLSVNYAAHNSVGGSLTAYVNGIHQAYPKRYGLIFARFLNKYKEAFPDVDNDISPSGRDKLHDYLRGKYGAANVAHVSNINTITPKVYARDIARIFEFGDEGRSKAAEVGNAIADSIPGEIKTIKQALKDAPLFVEYVKIYPQLEEFAELCGKPRAWSTHAGGIVISKRPLEGLAPLRRDATGALVLEWDKEKAEENGLIKIDTLGLETLDIISRTCDLIESSAGEKINPRFFDYEQQDNKGYDLISKGETFGVFQLGSTAVPVCKKVKPTDVKDIALISALVRPAAKDTIPNLLKVRDQKEEMTLLHPSLERAFANTYGFGLFEESLMYLAQDVAGWDLHDADKLRKLTKEKGKNPEKVKKWREEFINDSVKNNISEEIATKIWDETISLFNGYGFNRTVTEDELIDIYRSDGQYIISKPIKDVKPGEYVRSRDEKTKEDIFIKVMDNHDHGELEVVEVELDTGERVKCTMNHKFRTLETGEMLPLYQILEEGLSIVVNDVTKTSGI